MFMQFIRFVQKPRIQIISIILTSIYIGCLLFVTYSAKIFREHPIALEKPTPTAEQLANHVEVGLHINSFPYFSFKHTKFTIDGTLWFKFDQGMESLETLENFSIKNMVLKQEEKLFYRSKPLIKRINDKVLVSYHVQFTFMTEINFKKFPIGDHRLNLQIENRSASTQELLFTIKPENITFNEHLLVDDWRPLGVNTSSGIIRTKLGGDSEATEITYPGVGVTINFENIGARSLISLYFPLFVLFFIGLLSLSLGIFDPSRLMVLATSLPTLVLFRLVVDAVSPEVGYATHIDFVYYVLVLLSLLILFFQTYVMLVIEKAKTLLTDQQSAIKEKLEIINALLFITVLTALITIMTVDLFF